ncbi:MAG TPA: hypothetical protein VMS17_06895, partial [Gemmataceae bacterium]|nr:hypothetical protein [Gemmataceae bacterium]
AFWAEQALIANPVECGDFLKHRLHPVAPLDPKAVLAMIGDLDSDDFEVREKATDRLRSLQQTAVPLLKKALEATNSAEVRQRLERLLTDAEEPWSSPERLRDLRAVHCLAMLGTEAARQLLQELAKGATGAQVTEQAREELEWLK